jgi:ATP-dependent RNA helicase DeaD
MTFHELPLNEAIQASIDALGFESPTPIQEAVIPPLLEDGGDIIALAQTGTGKTAAFGLPILQMQHHEAGSPDSLILCPTRELAMQITAELRSYAAGQPGLRIEAVYGGVGYAEQISALRRGVHILVATPGRLLDLVSNGKADLSAIRYLVLDEADIMLNMGFKEELDAILQTLPAERRTVLLSATMPPAVARIASAYMDDPHTISKGPQNTAAEGLEHRYVSVRRKDKYTALKRLIDVHPQLYGIVFCRTKAAADDIAERLSGEGYGVGALHGDLSQSQRDQVMKRFRSGNLQLLIATDIAARGLDVRNLSHVIHYDLPDEIDIYTHRSGRTGRAGKTGISYAIVTPREIPRIKQIEKVIRRTIEPAEVPKGGEIVRRRLLDFADTLAGLEVSDPQIASHVEEMEDQLADLDRKELLQKICLHQFEQLFDYYRDAADPHPPAKPDSGRKSGGRFAQKPGPGAPQHGRTKNRRQPGNNSAERGYSRIRINLGSRDRMNPSSLIGLINQSSRRRGIEIGRIDIHPSWSCVQVEEHYAAHTAGGLDGFTYRGHKVRADLLDKRAG